MDLTTRELNRIDNLSLDIVKIAYGQERVSAPVRLSKVIDHFEFNLEFGEFENAEILSIYNRTKKQIFVASDSDQRIRNQAISVQIGHFFLHKDLSEDIIYSRDIIDPYSDDLIDEEGEAIYFATGLLMPRYLVLRYWQQFNSPKDYAYFFKVTNSFAYFRLSSLGLIE